MLCSIAAEVSTGQLLSGVAASIAQEAATFIGSESEPGLRGAACQVCTGSAMCMPSQSTSFQPDAMQWSAAAILWPTCVQVLKVLAQLDADAVWLELMTIASSGLSLPMFVSPDGASLPPIKTLLQGSCPPVPSPSSIPRAKHALRLLAAMPDTGSSWHACVDT